MNPRLDGRYDERYRGEWWDVCAIGAFAAAVDGALRDLFAGCGACRRCDELEAAS